MSIAWRAVRRRSRPGWLGEWRWMVTQPPGNRSHQDREKPPPVARGAAKRRTPGGAEASTYQEDGEGVRIDGVLLSRAVTDQVYTGNAQIDGAAHRGWILGHFMPARDIWHSEDVEIRWAVHQPGERRGQWVADERRSTAIIFDQRPVQGRTARAEHCAVRARGLCRLPRHQPFLGSRNALYHRRHSLAVRVR